MMTLRKFITDFKQDESGTVAVELCLVVPMLVWALLSTLVYFDAYRAESISTRAGLTLADMISREQNDVNDEYISNMRNVLRVLTVVDDAPDIRVTVYRYRASDDTYRIVWSENRGMTGGALTNADLEALRNRLPVMANGNRSILVETRTRYSAPFRIGMGPFLGTRLDDLDFQTFTVITPRFLSTICFDPTPALPANGDEAC